VQVTVEINRVAAMANDSMTVSGFFVKTVRHPIRRRIQTEETAVHQTRSLWSEYSSAFVLSILQMRDHEARYIGGRAAQAPCGERADRLKGFRAIRGQLIS